MDFQDDQTNTQLTLTLPLLMHRRRENCVRYDKSDRSDFISIFASCKLKKKKVKQNGVT